MTGFHAIEPDIMRRGELLRQALDPDACFLCGTSDAHSREHVFAKWLLGDCDLWDQTLHLPSGTSIPYRNLVVTCCPTCNNETLSPLEADVGAAFRAGADAVRQLDRERLFLWLAKFYYGLLFRDMTLYRDRSNRDLGTLMTNETLQNYGLHHLLLRRLLGKVDWNAFPASIFIFDALTSTDRSLNFDYFDSPFQPFVSVRVGATYVAAFLQDFGAVATAIDGWQQIVAARSLRLHPLQCRELTALFAVLVHHHHVPEFQVEGIGDRWSVKVLPRREPGGAAPFDRWDSDFYEKSLLFFLKVTLKGDVRKGAAVAGVPSFVLDANGEPFQAPDFDWMPPSTEPSGR